MEEKKDEPLKKVPKIEEGIKEESKEEVKEERDYNAQLKWVVIAAVFLFVTLIVFYVIYTSVSSFNYNGKEFQKTKIGNLLFYKVSFPLTSPTGKSVATYNIYLRNDPRSIENISVIGGIDLRNQILVTSKEDFICSDNNIALANFMQYFEGVERKTVNSIANATCANFTKGATLIKIENSSENSIKLAGKDCYVMSVNNCAILNVTERFIIENIAKS